VCVTRRERGQEERTSTKARCHFNRLDIALCECLMTVNLWSGKMYMTSEVWYMRNTSTTHTGTTSGRRKTSRFSLRPLLTSINVRNYSTWWL
jgi:hypothetical protein